MFSNTDKNQMRPLLDIVERQGREPLLDVFREIFPDMIMTQPVASPKANYWKDENGYNIEIAVPGMSKSDIKLYFNDNCLVVEGKVEKKNEERRGKTVFRNEFIADSFKETFGFGKDADKDSVKAAIKDGILTITVGKLKERKPERRFIDID